MQNLMGSNQKFWGEPLISYFPLNASMYILRLTILTYLLTYSWS
jgi:hypothetical protein